MDQYLRMAEAIVIGMKGTISAGKKKKKEKLTSQEKVKILAGCDLTWRQVGSSAPNLRLDHQGGRTRSAIQDAMELEYQSTSMVWEFSSCVFLLTQLVTNVKDLKFVWQGRISFESCHRGISPFSVPSSSIEVHQWLSRVLKEDAKLATMATLADVHVTRTRPPTYVPVTLIIVLYKCYHAPI